MNSIIEYFRQSELALAAYANLTSGSPNKAALIEAGMSDTQANQFISKYTVIDQFNSVTGASAAVFQEIATGQRYLAIQGTQGPTDFIDDYFILNGTPSQLNPQYLALKAQVQAWLADSNILQGQSFTVTGHSLGGYLAAGLTADFSTNISHAYLYNSPGNNSLISTVLQTMGILTASDPAKITSLRADAGISPIAALGNAFSTPIPIIIEDQFLSDVSNPPLARNHSQQVLTDALKLYSVLASLDSTVSITSISQFFKAASNHNNLTLELILDSLRKTILSGSEVATPEGDRKTLWSNITNLQNSATFQALIGQVTLVAPPASASEARNDLGNFLNLYYLTPFALKVEHAGALNSLYEANSTLAGLWNDDRNLTPEQVSNGEANFSDMYLNDRAAMLTWKLKLNTEDFVDANNGFGYIDGSNKGLHFEDITTGLTIDINKILADKQSIIFGEDIGPINADNLTGSSNVDHIYGLSGNDSISGGDGNDYIEGNAGQDTLKGDAGNDILIGGTQEDILNGGEGKDLLKGGAGMDVYQFNGTYGTDIITDKDGQGFVTIDNNPANSGTFKLENIYKNEGTGYTFTQVNGGTTLIISKEGDANRIIINDWSVGDLSINLSGSAPAAPQATLSGDFKTSISHFKTLNTLPCKPISMRVASLLLFDLNAHKTAANDATYNNTIERKAA